MDRDRRHAEGKRLGELLQARGLRAADLSRLTGVSQDVVSNILRGVTALSYDRLHQFAEALATSPEAIRPSLDRASIANLGLAIPVARAGYRMIPIYGAITAGQPAYTTADVIEWEEMPEWGGDFERWGRVIVGESMHDEFEEGDIAIFENRRHEPGHGVHAFCNGEDTFKIYRVIDGAPQLWPINSEYEPIPILQAEGQLNWKVKGVCIRRIRRQPRGVRDIREYPHGLMWRFR